MPQRLVGALLIALLVVGGCTSGTPRPAAPATTTAAPATTTAAPATTTTTTRPATTASARPRWCSLYDDWKQASDTIASIERQHGSSLASWPDGAYERWQRAFSAQSRAGGALWDGTEAGTVPRGWDARARACR